MHTCYFIPIIFKSSSNVYLHLLRGFPLFLVHFIVAATICIGIHRLFFDAFTLKFLFGDCNNSGHLEQPTVGGSIDRDILKFLRFNTVITTACHCGPCNKSDERRPHPHTLLFKMIIWIIIPLCLYKL